MLIRSCIFILAFLLAACNEAIKDPTFESVENVEVLDFDAKKIKIRSDIILANPNPFALNIAETDFVTIVNEREVAQIHQVLDSRMEAKENFTFPVEIVIPLEKLHENGNILEAAGIGLQLLSKREMEVTFSGTIKVGRGPANLTVPFERTQMLKF